MKRAPAGPARVTTSLPELVDGWVAAGLISPEQGELLRASEDRTVTVRPPPGRTRPMLVEALAYLGGAIVVTATLLLGSLFWSDWGVNGRFVVLACAVALLAIAGALTPAVHGTATGRLRSVLWLSTVVATVPALAVAADAMTLDEADGAALMTWGTATVAALCWYRWRTVGQQAATMVAVGAGGAALVAQYDVPDATLGLGVWTAGVAWALLAWCGLTLPRWLGRTAGSAMAVLGAMMTATSDPGTVFTLATLAAVLGASVWLKDPMMLGVAALGVVINVPSVVHRWFPGSVSVPLTLLMVGVLVVVVAVVLARRGGAEDSRPEPETGSPMLALTVASLVVAVVAAVVTSMARM